MGLFDRHVRNGFDAMFDIDRDGFLDDAEQAMQFHYLDRMSREDSEDFDEDDCDDILDEIDGMDREEAIEYLEDEGYDPDEFE